MSLQMPIETPRLPENRRTPARRAICALLALLLLLSTFAFAACGDAAPNEGDSASGDASVDSDSSDASDNPGGNAGHKPPAALAYRAPAETVAALPDYRMDGVMIIAADERCGPILGAHPMLASAFDGVNAAIKERYGADVYFQSYPGADLLAQSKKAVADGEFFADILAIPLADLPQYLAADLLMPISSLDGLSFFAMESSADAGDGILFDSTRAISVNGECYALLGSGALSQMGSSCLLFNHTLLDALLPEGEDLYAAVKSGQWTWDRLLTLLSAAQSALDAEAATSADSERANGDSAMSAYAGEKISLLGTTQSMDAFTAAVYKSFDTALTEEAPQGSFYLSAIEALQTLSETEILTGAAAEAAFREGDLLFLAATLDALYDYPNSDGSWGCLPLPKRNEESADYLSMLDPDGTSVYVVLKNSLRLEAKGGYLLALSAAAQHACLPTFVHELLSDYIREGASLDMIPYILAGAAAEAAFVTPESTAIARLRAAVAGETLAPDLPSDAPSESE